MTKLKKMLALALGLTTAALSVMPVSAEETPTLSEFRAEGLVDALLQEYLGEDFYNFLPGTGRIFEEAECYGTLMHRRYVQSLWVIKNEETGEYECFVENPCNTKTFWFDVTSDVPLTEADFEGLNHFTLYYHEPQDTVEEIYIENPDPSESPEVITVVTPAPPPTSYTYTIKPQNNWFSHGNGKYFAWLVESYRYLFNPQAGHDYDVEMNGYSTELWGEPIKIGTIDPQAGTYEVLEKLPPVEKPSVYVSENEVMSHVAELIGTDDFMAIPYPIGDFNAATLILTQDHPYLLLETWEEDETQYFLRGLQTDRYFTLNAMMIADHQLTDDDFTEIAAVCPYTLYKWNSYVYDDRAEYQYYLVLNPDEKPKEYPIALTSSELRAVYPLLKDRTDFRLVPRYSIEGIENESFAVKKTTNQLPKSYPILTGDLNQDATVDISDAVLMARLAVNDTSLQLSDAALTNADLNGDGKHDDLDLTMLLHKLAKLD